MISDPQAHLSVVLKVLSGRLRAKHKSWCTLCHRRIHKGQEMAREASGRPFCWPCHVWKYERENHDQG